VGFCPQQDPLELGPVRAGLKIAWGPVAQQDPIILGTQKH